MDTYTEQYIKFFLCEHYANWKKHYNCSIIVPLFYNIWNNISLEIIPKSCTIY